MMRTILLWLLLCGGVPLTLALAGDAPRPDPLPLRRVQIGPERVAAELARSKGILVQLPRSEFEARVQQAALAVELTNNPPRLVKTTYTAQLAGQSLVGGAEWSVLHTAGGPGLLVLAEFNLALGKRFQVDGAPALSGDLDGKTPSLWLDKPGAPTVYFDWSRRGVPAGDDLHFDLEVPPCANAHLELTLPADCLLSAGKPGLLVEGPSETGDVNQRKWTISFAGRSRLEFVVRRPGNGPGGPELLATVQTRQELGPQRVLADFDFRIEALHGSITQMVFACDAPLQPFEVNLAGSDVKTWQWLPPGPELPAQGQLTVILKASQQGLLPVLRVRCLAPLIKNKKDATWVSPGVRLLGAVSRGETLRLHVLPEAQLESWKPGHFRLAESLTEADSTQVLTLTHAGTALPRAPAALPGNGPILAYSAALGAQTPPLARPSAVVRAKPCEFLAQQRTWWQIDQQHSTLTTEIDCRPMRGQLFHVPLKLPADSQVEQISVEPKEMLRGWAAAGTPQKPLVLIDFAQPASLQMPVKIKLRARVPHKRPAGNSPLLMPFAEVEPLDPCLREGALAIGIHPQWRAELLKTSATASAVPPDGPWQPALTDYYFTFHGKALTGVLRLEPRAPQLKARCQSDVLLGGSRGTLVTRLTLEPSGGSLDHVDLLVSAPLAEPWKVRGEGPAVRIAGVHRLAGLDATAALLLLGSHHGLEALTVLAAQPGSQVWRIRFAEPVSSRIHLVLTSSFTPSVPWAAGGPGGLRTWSIPVVSVATAEPFTGADDLLAVQVLGAEIVSADAEKLQALPGPNGGVGKTSSTPHGLQQLWRVYRYEGSRPHLLVQARSVALDVAVRETCESASLLTYVEDSGRLVHHFKFQLRGWRKRDVPVLLPRGSQVMLASTEGRPIETFEQQQRADGCQLDLPASAALGVQHFELVYVTSGGLAPWAPWQRLPALLPQLPVKPLEFRRSWVLPAGIEPLDRSWVRLAHRPNELADTGPALSLESLWNGGQTLLVSFLEESSTPPWAIVQQQHLTTAEAALRKLSGPAKAWSLGQAVEWLVFDQFKYQVQVIVDTAALSAAGLTPQTPFVTPGLPAVDAWARLELVFVPTPSGLMLTTRQQWLFWGGQDTTSIVMPGGLADAAREASQRGHDSSGRFWSAPRWLRQRATLALGATLPELALMRGRFTPEDLDGYWTHWEAPAGTASPATLLVVRSLNSHILGLALALVWGLAAWGMRRRWTPLWRSRLLLTWLALLLLTAVWLPVPLRPAAFWPAGGAAALAIFWYCRGMRAEWPPVPPSPSQMLRQATPAATGAVVATLLVLVGLALPAVWSQAIDANTVLVLAGPPEAPERQSVLVTPELLKKLDALMGRGPTSLHGAVLTSANYEGTVAGDLAQFKAEFQLHCFDDKTTLTIPIEGVELSEGALLDGAPVQPVAAATGYTLTVKDKGLHQLTLFFSVRLQASPEHLDLRFTIPRLHQSRLQLQTPGKQAEWQVLSGVGHSSATSPDAQNRRVTIELGRDSTVHLRCPRNGPAASAAKITVREAYFWDLRGPDSECTGVLRYQVTGGSTAHLVLALPETLEPHGVDVAGEGDGDEAARPRLKSWQLAADKGQWRLHVWLQAPVSGQVKLTLRLLPRQPATAALRLHLPLPLDAQLAGGIMGYGLDHPTPKDSGINFQGVFLEPDLFKEQWPGAVPVAPTRAYTYATHNANSTLLVTLPPGRSESEQDLHWTVHPDHAEVAATLKVKAAGDDHLLLIEWEVPPGVTVAEITGDNVRNWTRAALPGDPRIQVWLKQRARTATLQLRGWTSYQIVPAQRRPVRWIVPLLRCLDGKNVLTTLRIGETPAMRVEADVKRFLNLAVLPQTSWSWQSKLEQGVYRAELLLRPQAPQPQVLGLTSVEVRDGVVQLSGFLHVHVGHGEAASFSVRAGQWQASLLKLEGPGVSRVRRPGWGEQEWHLVVPKAAPRRLVLQLTGRCPTATGLHFDLPRMALEGARWTDQCVAATTPGLYVQAVQGLSALKDTRGLPDFVVEHVGKPAGLWKVGQEDWRLSLGVAAASTAPNIQVLHAEQRAALGDTFGWMHQAALVLYVKESSDVTLHLPAGALLLAVSIDGEAVTPRFVGADQIALTLPPGEGVRQLRLRWMFARPSETLEQPRLVTPRLEGLPVPPWFWTVTLPAGYRLPDEAAALDTAPSLAAARQHLARAEAMAAAGELLAQHWAKTPADTMKTQLLACQKQFFLYCRLATAILESPTDGRDPTARNLLKHQVASLLQHNAAALHKAGLDKFRVKVEKSTAIADRASEVLALPVRGKMVRWQTNAASPPQPLKLVPTAGDARDRAWTETHWVLLAFAVLIGLTWVPRLPAIARRFWPEQIAAVAVLGWYWGGFSPLALALLVAAAGGRGWLLGSWLRWRRTSAAAT